MLDLTQLRSFVAVEQMGSFTLAAERLGLGQSTVSQHIQRLEAELGRRLLAFTRELLPEEIWLRCAEGNEKAWRWYERDGFVLEKAEADPLHGRIMKYYRWKRSGQPSGG